jgi:hypothetical protein
LNPPPGCRFHTRCPFAEARCRSDEPGLEDDGTGHQVACHFWRQLPKVEPVRAGIDADPLLVRLQGFFRPDRGAAGPGAGLAP